MDDVLRRSAPGAGALLCSRSGWSPGPPAISRRSTRFLDLAPARTSGAASELPTGLGCALRGRATKRAPILRERYSDGDFRAAVSRTRSLAAPLSDPRRYRAPGTDLVCRRSVARCGQLRIGRPWGLKVGAEGRISLGLLISAWSIARELRGARPCYRSAGGGAASSLEARLGLSRFNLGRRSRWCASFHQRHCARNRDRLLGPLRSAICSAIPGLVALLNLPAFVHSSGSP